MLNKKMNARKMVLILKENNAVKMPFLLSLNDYMILKEASRINPQIQIFKDCVDFFDKIGLYNKKHLDIFKKAVLSKEYNQKELLFLRNCLRENNKTFFTKVINFTRLKTEADFNFYNNLLNYTKKPVLVKSEDYIAVINLILRPEGRIFLNSFGDKAIEDIDTISKFCKDLYEKKIDMIYLNFTDKIKRTKKMSKFSKTSQINSLKKLWKRELDALLTENNKVLEIDKIFKLNNEIGELI